MKHDWMGRLPSAFAAASLMSGCGCVGYPKTVREPAREMAYVYVQSDPEPVLLERIEAPSIVAVSREWRGDSVTLRFDWSAAARHYVGAASMRLECDGGVTMVSPYWLGDMRMEVAVPLAFGDRHCSVYVLPQSMQSGARFVRQPIRYRLDGAW